MDIDTIHEILNDIVDDIDPALFEGLNGGVVLIDEVKYHDEAINEDLVVLGEYRRYGVIKQISIYYGSLESQYSHYNYDQLKNRLKELVNHELRHHVEYKAGLDDLVDEDNDFINKHKKRREKGDKK